MWSIADSRAMLTAAQVFFDDDGETPSQMLNLNDAFYWGCADGESVSDEELPRLAELFWLYGNAGIAYWVAVEKRGGETPEFVDVRRQIEFVKNEEEIRREEPNHSRRAYLKKQYTIGAV